MEQGNREYLTDYIKDKERNALNLYEQAIQELEFLYDRKETDEFRNARKKISKLEKKLMGKKDKRLLTERIERLLDSGDFPQIDHAERLLKYLKPKNAEKIKLTPSIQESVKTAGLNIIKQDFSSWSAVLQLFNSFITDTNEKEFFYQSPVMQEAMASVGAKLLANCEDAQFELMSQAFKLVPESAIGALKKAYFAFVNEGKYDLAENAWDYWSNVNSYCGIKHSKEVLDKVKNELINNPEGRAAAVNGVAALLETKNSTTAEKLLNQFFPDAPDAIEWFKPKIEMLLIKNEMNSVKRFSLLFNKRDEVYNQIFKDASIQELAVRKMRELLDGLFYAAAPILAESFPHLFLNDTDAKNKVFSEIFSAWLSDREYNKIKIFTGDYPYGLLIAQSVVRRSTEVQDLVFNQFNDSLQKGDISQCQVPIF